MNERGRPILFMHGFSQCWLTWRRQLESDLAADFRLIAVDLRGHTEGNRAVFRKLGRISFRCNEADGRRLAERWIRAIELHYEMARDNPDMRMMVQVLQNGFKAW